MNRVRLLKEPDRTVTARPASTTEPERAIDFLQNPLVVLLGSAHDREARRADAGGTAADHVSGPAADIRA